MNKLLFTPLVFVLLFCTKKTESPQPVTNTVIQTNTVTVYDTVYKNRPEPKVTLGSVLDNQGNQYKTVTIGGRTWMAENLRVQYYNNGDKILTTNRGYRTEASPKYWFNPDFINTDGGSQNNDSILSYGRLYTWYSATDERGVCPSGWVIPSVMDWQTLIDTLGGTNVAGGKMKEIGSRYWGESNGKNNGTNTSFFSAREAGLHLNDGGGSSIKNSGVHFWSATIWTPTDVFYRYDTSQVFKVQISAQYSNLIINNGLKKDAYSVRCIKKN